MRKSREKSNKLLLCNQKHIFGVIYDQKRDSLSAFTGLSFIKRLGNILFYFSKLRGRQTNKLLLSEVFQSEYYRKDLQIVIKTGIYIHFWIISICKVYLLQNILLQLGHVYYLFMLLTFKMKLLVILLAKKKWCIWAKKRIAIWDKQAKSKTIGSRRNKEEGEVGRAVKYKKSIRVNWKFEV